MKANANNLEYKKTLPKGKTLSGKISHMFYSSPEFSSGVIKTKDNRTAKFAGKLMVNVGDRVTFSGHWKNNPKYGWQFQVTTLQHDLNLDARGLAHYLKTNPAFKGIGPVKAEKVAAHFGDDFEQALQEYPEEIRKVAGLSQQDIEILQTEWQKRKAFNALYSQLSTYELTHKQITKLVDKFGHSAKSILDKDPYLLCREIVGFGFVRTDQIARKMGIAKNLPGRIQAALLHIVAKRIDDGHCWTEERELVDMAAEILALDDLDFQERIEEQVDRLLADKRLIGHNTGERMLIADPLLYKREIDLAQIFMKSLSIPPETVSGEELAKLMETEAADLTPTQQEAVIISLTSRISVASGAAGSGKSYTIAIIVRICEILGLDVALAAPTGKAAKRMEELADCEAMTIHRLLGYNGAQWIHNADNLLDYDIVILDEMSMTDIHLAWRFFDAIDITSTQVVLVGDCHQLPPIGPGNILRDLIDRKLIPTVILDQVVRQAGILKENCTAVLRGVVNPTAPGSNGILRPWYVIDNLEADSEVVSALLDIVENKLPSLGIDPVKDMQVLTPIKRGPLGVANLNIELQRLIQRLHFGLETEPVSPGKRPKFYQGDKIMQTKNNYNTMIMNGAIGFIKNIRMGKDGKGKPYKVMDIDFDGNLITVPMNSEEAHDLALAYCTSCHKFQGSEVPCALTIVHSSHYFMLHRNLLYTSVTRAQKTAIILGNSKGIQSAAARQLVEKRKTFLSVIELLPAKMEGI